MKLADLKYGFISTYDETIFSQRGVQKWPMDTMLQYGDQTLHCLSSIGLRAQIDILSPSPSLQITDKDCPAVIILYSSI